MAGSRQGLHPPLRLVQQLAGPLGEPDPFLEEPQRHVERKLAGLELLHDLCEPLHGRLERGFLSGSFAFSFGRVLQLLFFPHENSSFLPFLCRVSRSPLSWPAPSTDRIPSRATSRSS